MHLVPQPGGQHPVELRQRPERGVTGAGDAAARAGEQRDRGGDRLLVVEQQRRQVLPGPELVAAADALAGVHRIAERAQPLDVPPYRARRDPEPVGELGAGPDLPLLQQPEQGEHPLRRTPLVPACRAHIAHPARDSGPILSAMGVRVDPWTRTTSTGT